jgi:segregation and condensation protein A
MLDQKYRRDELAIGNGTSEVDLAPEMPSEQTRYVVRLPVFEGPLDLLLHLIEKRQMEITTISLVAVTDQYLAYLQHWQDEAAGFPPLANMAAFISIATRLLFIKSQSLLPATSKEQPSEDVENAQTMAGELRRHLLEYQAAKEIARHLRQREEAGLQTFERSGLLANIEAQLTWTPPTLLGVREHGAARLGNSQPQASTIAPDVRGTSSNAQFLAQAFQHILQRKADDERNDASLLPLARVSVRDCIAKIVTLLNSEPCISLEKLVENECSLLVIIVTFLAILDMWKHEQIAVRQDSLFGSIYLERGARWGETEASESS